MQSLLVVWLVVSVALIIPGSINIHEVAKNPSKSEITDADNFALQWCFVKNVTTNCTLFNDQQRQSIQYDFDVSLGCLNVCMARFIRISDELDFSWTFDCTFECATSWKNLKKLIDRSVSESTRNWTLGLFIPGITLLSFLILFVFYLFGLCVCCPKWCLYG